eukprot:8525371-Alexandrium_andersonii.AAC.1
MPIFYLVGHRNPVRKRTQRRKGAAPSEPAVARRRGRSGKAFRARCPRGQPVRRGEQRSTRPARNPAHPH